MELDKRFSNIYSFSENAGAGPKLNYLEIKKAAAIIRAINHKLRQSIIKLLDENKSLTVTEIYIKLRIEQSVASQHLAILRRADFVKTNREGKKIHYELNEDRINEVSAIIKELLKNY